MKHPNLELIDRFFEAYMVRDFDALRKVLSEDAKWSFPGQHPFSGIKNGFEEIVAFFDTMGSVMGKSNVKAEKLVIGVNEDYVIESQRIFTNRADGNNIDHLVCVLWKFSYGKIVEGSHFFASPQAADSFFTKVFESESSV
ncbi:nuclear transport factor 2 family protein [Leptospira alstonii]|uniref:nuclear transport factor 2 family protein n=1 Tax=Leptospira alstonii TaxID=28452 RepID=UPI000773C704|nr:nuclear transport factor 2 family protein [Leptospira alstonii]